MFDRYSYSGRLSPRQVFESQTGVWVPDRCRNGFLSHARLDPRLDLCAWIRAHVMLDLRFLPYGTCQYHHRSPKLWVYDMILIQRSDPLSLKIIRLVSRSPPPIRPKWHLDRKVFLSKIIGFVNIWNQEWLTSNPSRPQISLRISLQPLAPTPFLHLRKRLLGW